MPNPTNDPPKNLSRHQYGSLKFIHSNHVTLAYLRHAHANTLGSLAQRGYLQKVGNSDDAEITLTKLGEEALRTYTHASMNEREHEAELTDRCLRLLRYVQRKVVSMAS